MEPVSSISNWGFTQKQLFRFFGLYFFLYLFAAEELIINPGFILTPLVTWAGKLLHYSNIRLEKNGSGDGTYDYLVVLCLLVISVVGSIIWGILDRKRKNYDKLLYWLQVLLRYALATILLSYGFAKIWKTQFPAPSLNRLLEPYGNSSPMGLAWTFMGYSTPFNLFTGACEVIGGILLLFRRTTTFGCLFSIIVLTNVVVMNFCYDIPVKLYSLHLLFIAIFIVAPDIPRLYNFFFTRKTISYTRIYPVFNKKWMRITKYVLKTLLVGLILYQNTYESYSETKEYGDNAPKPPLWGIYNVQYFIRNNDTLPPLATDTFRWKQMVISYPKYMSLHTMCDSSKFFGFEVNDSTKTVNITTNEDTVGTTMHYTLPDKDHLLLAGNFFKDSVIILFKKKDPNEFRLISRGFHWVSEAPYNR